MNISDYFFNCVTSIAVPLLVVSDAKLVVKLLLFIIFIALLML